ncbi:elongation factor 1-delta [Lasius niger]|uniref:Elongation factor 1-delta n=1 Tax=Lasius niger TaxID=67767 RepID=A0A0J7KE22_LASNI|nr:elongation factor 1-delta [Lasius niger]
MNHPVYVRLKKFLNIFLNIFLIAIEDLKSSFEKLVQHVKSFETLEQRVERLEVRMPYLAICPAKPKESLDPEQESEHNKHQKQSKEKDDDNEDIDLFGSDSEASKQK